jgi:hypothetical protein
VLALVSVACLPEGEVLTSASAESDSESVERSCETLLGQAFQSPEERAWFVENCSRWPLVTVPQSPPDRRVEPPECSQVRGRPYESAEQRSWFLANCLGAAPAASNSSPVQEPRTDCNQIRGTRYASAAERDWYLANCQTTADAAGEPGRGAPSAQTQGLPDRDDCRAIRGTSYRSESERRFYMENCRGSSSNSTQVQGSSQERRNADRDDDD